MADTSFDIIIIGSGPGGYVAAIRAAQLGFKTAIVERAYLGGICLNWGCIPTKALLRSAEIFHYMQHAKDYGLKADNVSFDPAAVVKRSRQVSQRLNNGVGFLMKKNKVAVIWGEATIDAPGRITIKDAKAEAPKGALGAGSYQAKHIILATGARPRVLPGLERPTTCRSRCSVSAPAPLGSSSRASSARWAPTSRWSRCSLKFSR
jgi:dihydrolipoamide dehydrogenase